MKLYLITLGSLALSLAIARAQTNFTVLKGFAGAPDGAGPFGTIVVDPNGVLYSTTTAGGISNQGTVFAINQDGSGYRILHNFIGSTDGSGPDAGLTLGSDTNLYGVAIAGSVSNAGTVFKINRDGSGFTVLRSFTNGPDGKYPEASLIAASDGALYGTTYTGIAPVHGAIFKLNKDSSGFQIMHTFTGSPGDGGNPEGRLLEGSDGVLYGTANSGGSAGGGTVFKINKDGTGYTTIYNFPATATDGFLPAAGLIQGSGGVLYGSTYEGGGTGFNGTIFKINTDGSGYQTLFAFPTTGLQRPNGELIVGADGAFYGGTDFGGAASEGGIYKIKMDGTGFTTLRSFSSGGDGLLPKCGLLELTNIFYGTTEHGGLLGSGCVFALSPAPFVPRITSLSVSSTSNLLQFTATSTALVDVLRSTNLTNWSVMTTLMSPISSQSNFLDLSPPQPAAFYRLYQH